MSNFFAMVSRMRLIDRWALMQNTAEENIAEHSHNVAVIAHALCVIGNKKFGKTYNAERCALLALYHDTTEVITGDMPTPVKYGSEEMKNVYKNVEALAGERLLAMLPEEFFTEAYERIGEVRPYTQLDGSFSRAAMSLYDFTTYTPNTEQMDEVAEELLRQLETEVAE